jgi:beta-lactamase superfamily II metal-dependent hydrolase
MVKECEVHFLDVGQGSSSVILYQNAETNQCEAVVIDGGPPNTDIAAKVLEDFADYVRAVIVTHNHRDHIGGILNIVRTWSQAGRFGSIYLVSHKTEDSLKLAKFLKQDRSASRLTKEQTGFLREGLNFSLPAIDATIDVLALSPAVEEVILENNANEACGVIRVRCTNKDVLFCGDSTRETWERIRRDYNNGTPLECIAVTVPHHGGRMSRSSPADDGEWFFTDCVTTPMAIFSFGSCNRHGHPLPEVVCAVSKNGNGDTILCTQAHPYLNSPPYDGDDDHGLFPPTPYSLSYQDRSWTHDRKRRRHYACAGSVTLCIGPDGPEWGNGGDPDPICGFESLENFREKVCEVLTRRKLTHPPCHGGECPVARTAS